MIFFEKNKVLVVEPNRVLNIPREITDEIINYRKWTALKKKP
jgi:hypothetical protein